MALGMSYIAGNASLADQKKQQAIMQAQRPKGPAGGNSPGVTPEQSQRVNAWQSANTDALNAYGARYDAAQKSGAKNPYAAATSGPDAANQNTLEAGNLKAAGLSTGRLFTLGKATSQERVQNQRVWGNPETGGGLGLNYGNQKKKPGMGFSMFQGLA